MPAACATDMLLFAQGAMDTNTQVVTIGDYIHDKLPDASVMFHDAGAIAYYGDGAVYDMLGLVTNHQAGVANNGPGSRFEFLESLPPERAARRTSRTTRAGWATDEFYGDVLLHTPLAARFGKRAAVGGDDMQVIVATWDHVAHRRAAAQRHTGLGDRRSRRHRRPRERARARLGRRARPAQLRRSDRALVGGRERDGPARPRPRRRPHDPRRRERFTIAIDPDKPVRLVLRTGGARDYPYNETIERPIDVSVNGQRVTIPAPAGTFIEVPIELPAPHAASFDVVVQASAPYRAFHWFVLQPE